MNVSMNTCKKVHNLQCKNINRTICNLGRLGIYMVVILFNTLFRLRSVIKKDVIFAIFVLKISLL